MYYAADKTYLHVCHISLSPPHSLANSNDLSFITRSLGNVYGTVNRLDVLYPLYSHRHLTNMNFCERSVTYVVSVIKRYNYDVYAKPDIQGSEPRRWTHRQAGGDRKCQKP